MNSRTPKTTVMLMAAAMCAAGTTLAGCRRPASPAAAAMMRPTPTVRAEKVTMIDSSEPRSYVAKTSPFALVEVVARVSGTMKKDEKWAEGGTVKAGQLLYNIEDTVYAANVRSAQASLAQAQAELAFAKSEYDRYKTLIASKATSKTNYESSLRTLKSSEGRVEAAKAALALAKNDLDYTKIYSPINGKIGKSVYSSNNYITPSKGTLATIVQYDPIKLQFAMSEADYLRHFGSGKSKADLRIFRADGKEVKRQPKLDFVDNLADSATGTLMLQFLVPNPDEQLIPGGFATVKFSEKFEKPLPSVSISSLMTDGKHHFVYVVGKDNVVEKRQVVAGMQVGERQTILSGLKEGELVISGGSHKATPGQKVNPIGFADPNRK